MYTESNDRNHGKARWKFRFKYRETDFQCYFEIYSELHAVVYNRIEREIGLFIESTSAEFVGSLN